MRKLKLELDTLEVESFETGAEHRLNGTVRGHDDDTVETEWCTGYPDCGVSKRGCQTPRNTCYGSCGCTEGCTENCQTVAPYC
ncbi:MAG TPA: pinensin family lanthipeptide [Longimicrobium sp.]|nr:pinensin family lanthipeptide [Longimicrobium sp.]